MIQNAPERKALLTQLLMSTNAVLNQGKSQDQASRPNPQQHDQRKRPEIPQEILLPRSGSDKLRKPPPWHPGAPVKVSRKLEIAQHPARQNHGLERIQQDRPDLVLADVVSRIAVRPLELPVGVITALIGVPLFALLLRRTLA